LWACSCFATAITATVISINGRAVAKTATLVCNLHRSCWGKRSINIVLVIGWLRGINALTGEKPVVRCLIGHNWVVAGVFDPEPACFAPWRVCARCGQMQRSTFDHSDSISWETLRERNDITSELIRSAIRERNDVTSKLVRIVRQPTSRLDQLAHTFRLRRTRTNDRTASRRSVEKRKDQRADTALFVYTENARGVTRDVSASGAFFWTGGRYAVGASIRFAIEHNTANGREISNCRGHVLRIEPRDYMVGVAASIREINDLILADVPF